LGYLGRELGAEPFAHEYGVSMHEMAKTVVYSLHSLLVSLPSLLLLRLKERKSEKIKKRGFLVFGGFLRFKMGWHVLAFVSNNASRTRDCPYNS
jgi:hypothetical protein